MKYKVKMVTQDGESPTKAKATEVMLKDLLTVMPTLKKHKLEGELLTKVRKLRNGRKSKTYTLELTRAFPHVVVNDDGKATVIKELKAAAPLVIGKKSPEDKLSSRMEVMRKLKNEIRKQIQDVRSQNRPPIEEYTFSQGVKVNKLAEVYLTPGSFYKVFQRKIRQDMTRNSRSPSTTDNYVGIEIELASKKDRDFICDRLFEAGMGKFVSLGSDASIKVDDRYQYGHELRILVRQSEYKKVIETTCHVLNTLCEVRVDKSCGLHVHLDMRHRMKENAFNNLVLTQQFLYAMLPANRRNSKYSYPVKGAQWRLLESRYHGINTQAYSKFKTIEARMHCGTTHASKINNWIELLLAIVDAPVMGAAPRSIEGLKAVVGLSDDLTSYIQSRIAKFSTQHKNTVPSAEEPGSMPELEAMPSPAPADTTIIEESEVA